MKYEVEQAISDTISVPFQLRGHSSETAIPTPAPNAVSSMRSRPIHQPLGAIGLRLITVVSVIMAGDFSRGAGDYLGDQIHPPRRPGEHPH